MGLNAWLNGNLGRPRPEPIALLARRHNYFPKRFTWRGRDYDVFAVEQAWTELKKGQQVARHWFRVHCLGGNPMSERTFEIYQDVKLNTWYLAKQVQG